MSAPCRMDRTSLAIPHWHIARGTTRAGPCSARSKEERTKHPMRQLRLKDYLVIMGGILLIVPSLSFAHVNPVDSAGSAPATVVNTPLPVTLQGTGIVSGTVAAT